MFIVIIINIIIFISEYYVMHTELRGITIW